MSLSPLSHHVRFARPLLAVALGASLTFASACGSDSPTGPTNVPGTYVLRSIDGTPLPFAVPEQRDHVIVVNSVTATLNDNNTYAVAGTGTEDGNASTVLTDAGTFTQSGSTLHFTSTTLGGATYDATAKTDSFTVTLPGASSIRTGRRSRCYSGRRAAIEAARASRARPSYGKTKSTRSSTG